MSRFLILACAAAAGVLLAGCMTYPYASGFAACDNAAGACHRGCAGLTDEGAYRACAADCEYSADRCFAQAYEPYAYGGAYYSYGYGYGAPWYGSYGAWHPDAGYVFSFSYIDRHRYSRPHYGKRKPHHKRRDHDHDRKYARDRHDNRDRGHRYRDRSPYAAPESEGRADRFRPRSAEDRVRRTGDGRFSTRRAPPAATAPTPQGRAPGEASRAEPPPQVSSPPAARPAAPPPRADPPRAQGEASASRSGSRRVKTTREEVEPH